MTIEKDLVQEWFKKVFHQTRRVPGVYEMFGKIQFLTVPYAKEDCVY